MGKTNKWTDKHSVNICYVQTILLSILKYQNVIRLEELKETKDTNIKETNTAKKNSVVKFE